MNLAIVVSETTDLKAALAAHEAAASRETARLRGEIAKRQTLLNQTEAGLDLARIALAETVLAVTDFSKGGDDRNKARQDAINWLGTQTPVGGYGSLRYEFFGTKNYDGWRGQQVSCQYGYGPRHGSVCFSIGLLPDARKRDLTPEEADAAVYYLLNIERIQAAQAVTA